MSNQPDTIENYLDQVCLHLRVIPEGDLADIRSELREHLHLTVDALVADGVDRHDAAAQAIRRFGPASRIGNRILATFPYFWTWDWEGYSVKGVPAAPVALRIYFFWSAFIVCAVGSLSPTIAIVIAVLGAAAFGAAFESYRYIRDSFEIEARYSIFRREDPEKHVETALKPSRLYERLNLNRLPSAMRPCSAEHMPEIMGSNIGTLLMATVFADFEVYYFHQHSARIGISLLSYAYVIGAIASRAFLRYAARRPGLLFTFREHADAESA
jgi:hypothetical protein